MTTRLNPLKTTRSGRLATTDAIAPSHDPETPDDLETEEPETGPLRRCIVTRERQPKERMIRFVVGPDRTIVPDLACKLPGRGIWLSASGDVLLSGSTSPGSMIPGSTIGPGSARDGGRQLTKAFARAARGPVSVPPDLHERLIAALSRRIQDTLGLARRAGQAVAGFEKAREWVRVQQARVIVQASDGSPAERARFLSGLDPALAVIDPLPATALGHIFAREHTVHVAVSTGRLAEALLLDAGRISGLRRLTETGPGRMTRLGHEEAGANG